MGGLAALLLVGGVLAATAGTDWLEDIAGDDRGAEGDVELPDPGELAPGQPPEVPPPEPGDGAGTAPEVGCEPEGCELWRREVPPGQLMVTDDLLVVVHHQARAPIPAEELEEAEGEPPTQAVDLVALDPTTGEERWHQHIEVEGLAPRSEVASGMSSAPDEAGLVLTLGDVLVVHDLAGPQVRWAEGFGHPVHWWARADEEHLVVGGHLDRPLTDVEEGFEQLGIPVILPSFDGDAAGEDVETPEQSEEPPGGPLPASGHQMITVADADTGERRFATVSAHGSVVGSNVVIVLEGETRWAVALDPASGDVVWRRTLQPRTQEGVTVTPQVISNDRVLLRSTDGVEVVDIATGEVLDVAEWEEDGPESLQVVGDLLVWREERSGSPVPAGRGRVAHLDQPDEPILDLAGLTSVIALAPPTPSIGAWLDGISGYALLQEDGDVVHVRVLESDGRERWSHEFAAEADGCCARLHPGSRGDEIIVVPADENARSARRFAVDEGRSLEPIVIPGWIEDFDHIQWDTPVTTVHGADPSQRSYVVGPDGVIEFEGGHALLPTTRDGVPLLLVGEQLLALDPRELGLPLPDTVTGDE